MKRINLVIGVIIGMIIAVLLYVIFLPTLWLLGADKPYEKTHDYLDKLIFNKED